MKTFFFPHPLPIRPAPQFNQTQTQQLIDELLPVIFLP